MPDPSRSPDMTRLIEAMLSAPRTGAAVARAMGAQSEDRAARALIAEMRARRAEHLRDSALDLDEARRMGAATGDGVSPWVRSR